MYSYVLFQYIKIVRINNLDNEYNYNEALKDWMLYFDGKSTWTFHRTLNKTVVTLTNTDAFCEKNQCPDNFFIFISDEKLYCIFIRN